MTNDQAITHIFQRDKGKLLNYIRNNVSSGVEAEDVLQDVFYSLIDGFPQINALEKVTSWLYTVTRNRITDLHRKKKPSVFSDLDTVDNEEDESYGLLDFLPQDQTLPDDEVIREAFWEEVELALDELPENQREVFVLNEFEGYSFKEISEMLAVPVNTLISRKRYAVNFLRTRLQNLYKELQNDD
ncbi:MAG: sigma-70 family RNA polymerase sigma factor [Ignavibacteria bacterium]|nr:sigma-70 family RNA polymerase sigma factor [Ignavibacteria bacterium]